MDKFTKINDGMSYLRHPQGTVRADSTKAPSVIVLCTWMGAASKHINKYVEVWRSLYPNADIVLIRSSLAGMLHHDKAIFEKGLDTVKDILMSHLDASQPNTQPRPAVLHLFSNGGTFTSTQLVARIPPARRDLFRAVILDSCPGMIGYTRTINAMVAALPVKSRIVKLLLTPLMHLIYILSLVMIKLFRRARIVTQAIDRLNDPAFFSRDVPRIYLFSKADAMMPWTVVEQHVAQAREKGYKEVKSICFEDSAHCQHAVYYPEKYWGPIKEAVQG